MDQAFIIAVAAVLQVVGLVIAFVAGTLAGSAAALADAAPFVQPDTSSIKDAADAPSSSSRVGLRGAAPKPLPDRRPSYDPSPLPRAQRTCRPCAALRGLFRRRPA